MSKKKFAAGLESLFGDALEEGLQDSSPLLHHDHVRKKDKQSKQEHSGAKNDNTGNPSGEGRRKRSSKNFTSDLDSLFEDALKETVMEKVEKIKEKTFGSDGRVARKSRKSTVALAGIDALIRKTGDLEPGEMIAAKKRVTFVFDRQKFQKLKSIAREERMYLKDIIGDVVTNFIQDYESKHNPKNK